MEMSLYRLPDLELRGFFHRWKICNFLPHLDKIPLRQNFCAVHIRTWAVPIPKLSEQAGWVAHIPTVSLHTSWAALERATALLSEHAAQYGWHFHMPIMPNSQLSRYHTYRLPESAETKAAYGELEKIIKTEEEPGWHDYLHDIGAKGRRQVYLGMAKYPDGYALGVRVQLSKEQKTSLKVLEQKVA